MVRAPHPVRLAAACALLLAGSWSAALAPTSPEPVVALPGAYVTLPFELVGDGAYTYRVDAPEPWAPLAGAGRVEVTGSGFVSVTVRVPAAVAAGTVAPIVVTFQSEADPADVAVATGRVEVLARAAIELMAPDDLEARFGERAAFSLFVRNAGNVVDQVRISAPSAVFDVRFDPSVVELRPGEQVEVAVTVEVQGVVSSGYRASLRIAAASENDAEVVGQARTAVVFFDAATEAAARAPDAPPSLEFRVQSGVRAGVALDGIGASGFVEYELRPGLGGALSDHVDVQAGTGPLAGSISDPFAQLPSSLDVALTGADWDASARLGSGRYALEGGRVVGDWRVGGGASVTPSADGLAFGVDAFAASLDPDLDLQFSGRVAGAGADRQDGVAARYRLAVAEGLSFGIGADLLGRTTATGYEVAPVLHQSLTWQTQGFDVTQSYATVPLARLHTFGVSGGLRVLAPIGVRASTSVQLAPDATRSRTTLTVSARPAPRFSVALAGSFATSGAGAAWGVRPSASYGFSVAAWRFGVSAGADVTRVAYGVADAATGVRLAGSVGTERLSVATAFAYRLRAPAEAPDVLESLRSLNVQASYHLGADAVLRARAGYELETASGSSDFEARTELALAWDHRWTPAVRTRVAYDRAVTEVVGSVAREERLSVVADASDVAVAGLSLGAGYAVSSGSGLLTGQTPLRHDFSVRLGYLFRGSVRTPDAVVAAFGGRRGGTVSGVAYLDRDLDGQRGPDEPVVEGLSVTIDGRTVVTDAEGRYELRAGAGGQSVAYGPGVPALTAVRAPSSIDVEDDGDVVLDVRMVPALSVNVTLFDDLDQDGAQGPDEGGIAFGGVVLEGPERHAVRVDVRGSTVVNGLVPGAYAVRPDPELLPARYRATTEPVLLVVREGERPAPVAVGAAAPPRTVVKTFAQGSLAVLASADATRVPAGADVVVTALVTGGAQRVVVRVAGTEVELDANGPRWAGVVRVPRGMVLGPLELRVQAEATGAEAESVVRLEIIDAPLVRLARVAPRVGEAVELRATTAFAATTVELDLPGYRVAFTSADGREWRGTWTPEAAGTVAVRFVVDGDALDAVDLDVVAAPE